MSNKSINRTQLKKKIGIDLHNIDTKSGLITYSMAEKVWELTNAPLEPYHIGHKLGTSVVIPDICAYYKKYQEEIKKGVRCHDESEQYEQWENLSLENIEFLDGVIDITDSKTINEAIELLEYTWVCFGD